MSKKSKESRINIEDLTQAERELTPDEAKEVKGSYGSFPGGVSVAAGDVDGDKKADIITETDASKVDIQEGTTGLIPPVPRYK